jgi:hypothetical protein
MQAKAVFLAYCPPDVRTAAGPWRVRCVLLPLGANMKKSNNVNVRVSE